MVSQKVCRRSNKGEHGGSHQVYVPNLHQLWQARHSQDRKQTKGRKLPYPIPEAQVDEHQVLAEKRFKENKSMKSQNDTLRAENKS